MRFVSLILLLGALVSFNSCRSTRRLSEGEVLHKRTKLVRVKKDKSFGKWKHDRKLGKYGEMLFEIWDPPNGAFWGLPFIKFIPLRLYVYNAFYTEKEKGLRRFLMLNFGEPPKTMKDENPEVKIKQAVEVYENRGHFGTRGEYKISPKRKGKKAKVKYTLRITPPYHYRNLKFIAKSQDSTFLDVFETFKPSEDLQKGREYNLRLIKAEKQKLLEYLRNKGYYYLDTEDIQLLADTGLGSRELDLRILLDPKNDLALQKIHLNEPQITFDSLSTLDESERYYVSSYGRLKRSLIDSIISLKDEELYNSISTRRAINKLNQVGIFNSPRLSYSSDPDDSTRLNVNVDLVEKNKLNFSLRTEAAFKDIGFLGPSAGLSVSHLNTFGGAENLQFTADYYYDFPLALLQNQNLPSNGLRFGISATSPIISNRLKFLRSSASLPIQSLQFSYELNNRRGAFRVSDWNATYRLSWNSSERLSHVFTPASATYKNLFQTSADFQNLLETDIRYQNSFEDQFVLSTGYDITWNNIARKPGNFGSLLQLKFETAGNFLDLVHYTIYQDEPGGREFFGIPYSHYAKMETTARLNYKPSPNTDLIFRSQVGLGGAFGNSDHMPFSEQFFIGGTAGIRPFAPRVLGPGSQIPEDGIIVDQSGDIKIVWNLEYRFRVAPALHMALFTDAGNIWLLRPDPSRPNGDFEFAEAISEHWVTSGFGFRYDLSFLVLRLDVGGIVYSPIFIEGRRWVWQFKFPYVGPVFALGYPF